MKQKIISTIILLAIIIIAPSCDESTAPESRKSVRDYTWTLDTLKIPDANQNLMRSIYGANSKDIYLVGHNSGSPMNNGNGGMWHYDGNEWSIVILRAEIGPVGTLNSVHGSSSNNVWAVGGSIDYATILQYNGVNWKKHLVSYNRDGLSGTPLARNEVFDVYAESETEVWACGAGGLVYHYDGTSWDVDTLDNPLTTGTFHLRKIVGNGSNKYMLSTNAKDWNTSSHYYIYKYTEGTWEIIDTFTSEEYYSFGVTDMYYSSFGELHTVGPEIFKYQINDWEQISVDYSTWIWSMFDYGRSNMISVGYGKAFHFNGSDWKEIEALTDSEAFYRAVWMDDKNTFVVGYKTIDNKDKTIVWHGK